MSALRECGEVESALVRASIQGRREGHERRLHVVQGALDEAVVILNDRHKGGFGTLQIVGTWSRDMVDMLEKIWCGLLSKPRTFLRGCDNLRLETVEKDTRCQQPPHNSTAETASTNGNRRKAYTAVCPYKKHAHDFMTRKVAMTRTDNDGVSGNQTAALVVVHEKTSSFPLNALLPFTL